MRVMNKQSRTADKGVVFSLAEAGGRSASLRKVNQHVTKCLAGPRTGYFESGDDPPSFINTANFSITWKLVSFSTRRLFCEVSKKNDIA